MKLIRKFIMDKSVLGETKRRTSSELMKQIVIQRFTRILNALVLSFILPPLSAQFVLEQRTHNSLSPGVQSRGRLEGTKVPRSQPIHFGLIFYKYACNLYVYNPRSPNAFRLRLYAG